MQTVLHGISTAALSTFRSGYVAGLCCPSSLERSSRLVNICRAVRVKGTRPTMLLMMRLLGRRPFVQSDPAQALPHTSFCDTVPLRLGDQGRHMRDMSSNDEPRGSLTRAGTLR